jgi:hypothetical protein
MKRGWIIPAAAAVTAGLVLAVAVRTRKQTAAGSPVVPSASASALRLRVAYPTGTQFTYRWELNGSTTAQLGEGSGARGTADLAGELVLRGYGDAGGASLVGVSVGKLERHRLSALDQELLGDPQTVARVFEGREAFAEVASDGTVRAVRFRASDPALFKNVVLTALSPVAMTLRDGSTAWTLAEKTSLGLATTKYTLGDATGEVALSRERTHYDSLVALGEQGCADCVQRLASSDRIHLDPAGWLRGLAVDEQVRLTRPDGALVLLSTLRSSLELKDVSRFGGGLPDLRGTESAQLGDSLEDGDVAAKMLAARVNGLTVEQLVRTLSLDGAPERGFVGKASALLMQHPEHCSKLVTLFEKPETSSRKKALVLDVLASAASPQAQKAMREALASRAATGDAAYPMLLQRFSFVPRPDRESAAFVAAEYARARRDGAVEVQLASAHTLGSIAGALSRTAPELARRYDQELRDDLARSKSAREQKELIAALGNASSDEDARVVAKFAASADPTLRAEAALALRDATSADARATMVSLVGDAEPSVEAASLSALLPHPLAAEEAQQLQTLVTDGKTSPGLDNDLVSFLAAKSTTGTDVRAMLTYIAQRTGDNRVRARANLLLEQLAAAYASAN